MSMNLQQACHTTSPGTVRFHLFVPGYDPHRIYCAERQGRLNYRLVMLRTRAIS